MLIRLNLSTGRQDALLNSLPSPFYTFDFWFSPDDRLLVYTDDLNSRLVIWDLIDWEIQPFDVEIPRLAGIADPLMSPEATRVIFVVLLLVENPSYELETTYGVALFNLEDGFSELLLENISLYPVSWEDPGQVLMTTHPNHPHLEVLWLLDIETGELTEVEKTE